MIDDLIRIIREGINKDPDVVFINEAFAFVRDERGRMNAEEGEHDDTVMAKAIAFQLFPWGDNDIKGLRVYTDPKIQKQINNHKIVT
jgi:phage terminase large subunit